MCNREWKLEEFNDVETMSQYEICLKEGLSPEQALEICANHSRDNARTPMQWNHETNAGFTSGEPWMPLNENYKEINVEDQEKEYGSVLNFYKRLIRFRKSEEYKEILTYGTYEPRYMDQDHIFAYQRCLESKKLTLICNFSSQPSSVTLASDYENVVFVNYEQTTVIGADLQLRPYEVVVLEN